MREVSMARRAAFAFSSSSAGTRPSTFFWFGQMIIPDIEGHDEAKDAASYNGKIMDGGAALKIR